MSLKFDSDGDLEPGEHLLAWKDFCDLFGQTDCRAGLLKGLKAAAASIKSAGGRWLWIDGSFVTQKEEIYGVGPNDFDGCWDVSGVNPLILDPVLLDFDNGRARQKLRFGGELFPSNAKATTSGKTFREFFQVNKHTGKAKGIILIDLRSLP
jgi:hypothetical protein